MLADFGFAFLGFVAATVAMGVRARRLRRAGEPLIAPGLFVGNYLLPIGFFAGGSIVCWISAATSTGLAGAVASIGCGFSAAVAVAVAVAAAYALRLRRR